MRPASLVGRAALLLGVAVATFATVRSLPGDPATTSLFQQGAVATAEAVAAIRAEQGLDRPLWLQFAGWFGGMLTGAWGTSLRTGEPVLAGFAARLPITLAIGAGGLLAGAGLAYRLAVAAAAGSRLADRATRILAVAAQSLPAFVTGLALLWVFGVRLGWIRPFTGGVVERILLPLAVVALYATGRLARLIRQRFLEVMRQPWFTTARAKGLTLRAAVRDHAGPFGFLTLLAALRAEAAWVIGGTAVTEVLFGAPGVSAWVVESIAHRDYAVLQAYILFVAAWMLAIHAAIDGLARRIDPRIGA